VIAALLYLLIYLCVYIYLYIWVMPALLYHLQVEAHAPPGDEGMDCGVAAVYSCTASCCTGAEKDGDGYAQVCHQS
jgi:hypothetical protein